MRIVILQNSQNDPPMLIQDWLAETGAQIEVLRLFDGDAVPADTEGMDALVCLGGEMSASDDEVAPWLPATRTLLASAVQQGTPTLAVCLGAQLLAKATGGTVERGADGPEYGAYLTARRDAADQDPLFVEMPMTPDVMQAHDDVITVLPPDAVLLMAGTGYQNQAFRVGEKAWGLQFHIEASAATVRAWAEQAGVSSRLGPELDEAQENMALVWRYFVHRFAEMRPGGSGPGRRLPLVTS